MACTGRRPRAGAGRRGGRRHPHGTPQRVAVRDGRHPAASRQLRRTLGVGCVAGHGRVLLVLAARALAVHKRLVRRAVLQPLLGAAAPHVLQPDGRLRLACAAGGGGGGGAAGGGRSSKASLLARAPGWLRKRMTGKPLSGWSTPAGLVVQGAHRTGRAASCRWCPCPPGGTPRWRPCRQSPARCSRCLRAERTRGRQESSATPGIRACAAVRAHGRPASLLAPEDALPPASRLPPTRVAAGSPARVSPHCPVVGCWTMTLPWPGWLPPVIITEAGGEGEGGVVSGAGASQGRSDEARGAQAGQAGQPHAEAAQAVSLEPSQAARVSMEAAAGSGPGGLTGGVGRRRRRGRHARRGRRRRCIVAIHSLQWCSGRAEGSGRLS